MTRHIAIHGCIAAALREILPAGAEGRDWLDIADELVIVLAADIVFVPKVDHEREASAFRLAKARLRELGEKGWDP